MSEADSNYQTPEAPPVAPNWGERPEEPRVVVYDQRVTNITQRRGGIRRFFRGVGAFTGIVFAAIVGTAIVANYRSPDTEGPATDPAGNIRDDKGCFLDGRADRPESLQCKILDDLDTNGMAETGPPRTEIAPLPEGESGRVGYNRVQGVEGASPTSLSLEAPALSLTLK